MKEYFDSFIRENKEFEEPFARLHECIMAGNNTVGSHIVSQTLLIDDSWVEQIEAAVLSIERIAKNPKTFIKTEREILPADRTKKVDGETIRYLARHTADINEIDGQGNVKPKRLNSGVTDVETGIYENRVVYALVLRLENFLRRTGKEIENRINTIDSTTLAVDSQYIVDDAKFDCNITLKMDKESANKIVLDKNQKLLAAVKEMSNRVKQIKRTQFCKELSAYKKIVPPLNRTNLFKMNYDYKNCYDCWGLLSANNEIDCRLEVTTEPLPLLNPYFKDISYLVLAATLTFVYNSSSQKQALENQQKKKKKAVRKFKVARRVNYQPLTPQFPAADPQDLINQYYYDKMVELLLGKEEDKEDEEGKIARRQALSQKFVGIFSSVRKIDMALYEEALGLSLKEEIKGGSVFTRKKALVSRDEERIEKYQTIINSLRKDLALEERKQNTRVKNLETEKKKLALLQVKEEALEKEKAEKLAQAQKLKEIAEEKAKEKQRLKEEREKAKEAARQKKERLAKEAEERRARKEAEKAAKAQGRQARKEGQAAQSTVSVENQRAQTESFEQEKEARAQNTAQEETEAAQAEIIARETGEEVQVANITLEQSALFEERSIFEIAKGLLQTDERETPKNTAHEQTADLKAQETVAEDASLKAEKTAVQSESFSQGESQETQEENIAQGQAVPIEAESIIEKTYQPAVQEGTGEIQGEDIIQGQEVFIKEAKAKEADGKVQEETLAKDQIRLAEKQAKKAAAEQAKLEKKEFAQKELQAKASLTKEAFALEQIRLNEEELLKEQNRLKEIKKERQKAEKERETALSQQEILQNHKRYRQLYYEMTLKIKAAEERKEAIKKLKEMRQRYAAQKGEEDTPSKYES